MREMKDSGVEWIGEIPASWQLLTVGSLFRVRNEKVNDTDYPPLSVTKGGIVPQMENVAKSDANDNRKMVLKHDFVINSRSDRKQSCGVSPMDGSVSLINIVLYPAKGAPVIPAYLNYLLKNYGFAEELYRWGHGIVADLWTTRWQEMKSILLPIPSMGEQQQILEAISEKTDKVDTLIANVEAQIEKLKDYKQSLITEVVTKGLDHTVPMKDSGVAWIGEIPAHWEIKRGKVLFEESDARSADGSEELLTVSQYTGITPRSQKNVNMFEALTLEGYKLCDVGDIAANTMWLWAGAIGVSAYSGVISPSYNVYRQKAENFVPSYLDCLLRAPMLVQEYASRSTGIRASRLRLYPKDFLDIMFPVPPVDEQQDIMSVLSEKFAAVDKLIAIKKSKIEKLEQYKKSLIYEYVTGKKEA
jgi:type I DNA specificity S subunit